MSSARGIDRDRLVTDNLDVARAIARRVQRKCPPEVDPDDLVSSAYLGLTQAARRYDPASGVAFRTYASKRIQGAVYDALRTIDFLPRRLRRRVRLTDAATRELVSKLGRAPDAEEIAAQLGVSLHEYQRDFESLLGLGVVGLGSEAAANGPHDTPMVELMSDRRRLRDALGAIETLCPRHARVITMIYFDGLPSRTVAAALGVSAGRVSQLHARAIARLRATLEAANDIAS